LARLQSHAVAELVDDAFLPVHQFGHLERRRRSQGDAMTRLFRRAMHGFEFACNVDHRFGRDAATDQTGAAEPVGFDEGGIEAELARPDRGHIAAWSSTNNKDLRSYCFSHRACFAKYMHHRDTEQAEKKSCAPKAR
jgi:hypothetical protein